MAPGCPEDGKEITEQLPSKLKLVQADGLFYSSSQRLAGRILAWRFPGIRLSRNHELAVRNKIESVTEVEIAFPR